MKLENVIPWGRSFDEYLSIFNLSRTDLTKKILGCGDGPASFNATLTQTGGTIVSVDPLYEFSAAQIQQRVDAVYSQVLAEMQKNYAHYHWNQIKSVAELGETRMSAMQKFLTDFECESASDRYHYGALPRLEFRDQQFDLALCSHFLFLYSEQFGLEHHIQSVQELCRVAGEVRIYPLVSLDGKISKHLDPVLSHFESSEMDLNVSPTNYRFQKGATEMLVAKLKNNQPIPAL